MQLNADENECCKVFLSTKTSFTKTSFLSLKPHFIILGLYINLFKPHYLQLLISNNEFVRNATNHYMSSYW